MPDMTIFMDRETSEPQTLAPEAEEALRRPIADCGAHTATCDLYSSFAMFAAVHALQQIQAGADPVVTATAALDELACSGDFDEHSIDLHPEVIQTGTPERPWFTVAPVAKTRQGYEWAA